MTKATALTAIISAVLLAAFAGCGGASPAQTQAGVEKAQDAGMKDVADARTDASDKMVSARKELTKTQDDVARDGAEATRSVTIAKAEAAHKVALARCDAETGAKLAACKKLADTELAAAKANAEMTQAANDPKA
jgi:uncharacterized protein YdeI (BOF family)